MSSRRHLINLLDFSTEELEALLQRAAEMKARLKSGIPDRHLIGKTLLMFFEKPSMRTRVSLEAAMGSMGGTAIYLDTDGPKGSRLGERESLADVGRVASRYADLIAIRTFEHEKVEKLAQYSSVPVINALSDWSHPTQALADILTLREAVGDSAGKTFVFVGDGNNVARSLAAICARLGIRFILCRPDGYAFCETFLGQLRSACPGADLVEMDDPGAAVKEAAVIYTDVWASMGQEEEKTVRNAVFAPYQVNESLLSAAPAEVRVMHCLPAHRGEEITDGVMEASASIVFDQAENRMHINRAVFDLLLTAPVDANA